MRNRNKQSSVKLTVTLTPLEFKHFVEHGMYCLGELGDLGLINPTMPRPKNHEEARDVAVFGLQEMIATCAHRSLPSASQNCLDEDIPI